VTTHAPARPEATEYAPYYEKYVTRVPEGDIVTVLDDQLRETVAFLEGVPADQATVLHPPYTWSIKQVVGHVNDCERIFGYRALRFARNDATPLPGFDQDVYVKEANFDALPLADLVAEFEALRRANVCFFRSLSPAAWARGGVANDNPVTVRALAYIMAGHVRHHLAILRRRLGQA
jgi:hypothetical protein